MAEKTLYLHAGIYKTASTTLQVFCGHNREVLARKGICFPDPPFKYKGKGVNRNGLFLSSRYYGADGKRNGQVENERYALGLEMLHDAFSEYDTVLLSDEALWRFLYSKDCFRLRRLHKDSIEHGYKIRIIIYLRRQDQFIESYWNQRIKEHDHVTVDFNDYKDAFTTLDYYARLSAYEKIVGKDGLIVRRFEDLIQGDGAISNFLAELGLELTDEFTVSEDVVNTRIYGNAAIIKKAFNSLPDISSSEHAFISNSLFQISDITQKLYPCSEFSEEDRAAYMSAYEEGNARIAQEYLCDGRPLFSDDYSGPPKREDGNPEFVNDVIRTCLHSNVELYRKLRESEKAVAKLEERIEKLEGRMGRLRHPLKAVLSKSRKRN